MRCASCGFENASGIKFCGNCGTALKLRCGGCGFENAPGIKFCGECGRRLAEVANAEIAREPRSYTPRHLAEKILTARSALEGERKQVTVLFADIKGSMELAERFDPEEWHKILDGFFLILSDGVHRFEGTVNQYTGDGIMALFGAPIAHEDHARRACLAVLHLRDALRGYTDEVRRAHATTFAVRIGLNSGEVVVGRIGDDLRMDYTAQGHTVGLAQRMEQLAEPGGAYLTAQTARLVEGYFKLRPLGDVALKGSSEAIGVYSLEGLGSLRTHLELSQARGLSKFVGRAAELATLEAALERSLEAGGQTVGVVADAGTGKSRLCFEFAERCRSRGFAVIEARGVAHGRRVPLLPMLELFRAFFGVEEGDAALAVREKIAGRLLLLDETLREDLPIFFNLLGVPDPDRPLPATDPEALQRRAYAAVRAIVRADGLREKPAIVLFEDLHWLDAASEGYLVQIVEATATTHGLVLVNFRPEYRAPWMQAPSVQRLPLVPLGEEAMSELLADLLGSHRSVSDVVEIIQQRAGGNPFFIEEMVQTLVETGALEGTKGSYRLVRPVDAHTLPATVQAVLAARIDRLAEREKRLLQQASVVGKTFSERVLMRISALTEAELREAIRILRDGEFLYEESLYPQVVHAFKHPLTQEVADRTQLRERRAETHAAVARAIEELSGNRLDEEAALIAHHCEEAGERLVAAGWHGRAARWIGVSNYDEAHLHWRRVVELIPDTEDSSDAIVLRLEALRTLLMLAFRIGAAEDEGAALFAAAQRDAKRIGDDSTLAILTCAYAALFENVGAIDKYSALVAEASCIADRSGDREVRAAVGPDRIIAAFHRGQLSEACAAGKDLRAIVHDDAGVGAELLGYSPYVTSYVFEAFALVDMGLFRDAETSARRGLELAQRHGPDETRCWAHWNYVRLADARGDRGPGAADSARLSLETAERSGSRQARMMSRIGLSWVGALEGEWVSAVAAAEEAIRISRSERVSGDFVVMALSAHASALLGAGDLREAVAASAEGVAVAKRQGQSAQQCEATIAHVRCVRELEGAGGRQAIETLLEDAVRLVEETGAERWRPHVHAERGELYRLAGDTAAAAREFKEAHRLFVDMSATGHAAGIARKLTG